MPLCSLNCTYYNNLIYGNYINALLTEDKCVKCNDFIFEGCYDICHRCCDIFSLEFLYQHKKCTEVSKYEKNYEKVIDEIKKINIIIKDNKISKEWTIKLKNEKTITAVNCNFCGGYICMKKSNKYPKKIFCDKWRFVKYERRIKTPKE